MTAHEIYYFSGTGNSLAAAKGLAKKTGAKCIHIAALPKTGRIKPKADMIGFVFPLYDFKAPDMMEDTVIRMDGLKGKYVYTVCTYGIAPRKSLERFAKAVSRAGGSVSASFAVQMPHNGIGSGAVRQSEKLAMFDAWKSTADEVSQIVKDKRCAPMKDIHTRGRLLRNARMMPSLMRFLGRWMARGIDSLALCAGDDCVGCGTCAAVCPAANITLKEKRPVWSDHCAGCFACLHWCPHNAISPGDFDANIRPYHHPGVSLSEIKVRK